jgi:hypothetical protein
MKDQILREILYKIRTRPDLKKKLKIAIVIGVIGLFITGGLLIWAGVAALNYVGSQLQAANVKGAVENLQTEIKNIPAVGAVNTVGCWTQAQSMLTVETWLNRPLADNFNQLKKSCLQSNPSECVGEGCPKPKESPSGSWG